MNKKSVLFKSIALTSVFVLNMGLYLNLSKAAVELDAYSISDLPTTIDLNDCTDEQIRTYYSSLNSLDSSERQGTNLLKNLKPILSNNQKYYSYDSNTKIWQMYEITDRDWSKSPASGTTYGTYNSVTNKITNYIYGTNKDGKNNPYVHALYINRNIDNQTKAWGNHNQDGWGINQEHIWAKSHGFDTKGSDSSGGARGDPMHLWAGNGWANHEHSNYFYAFVDKDRAYSDAGTKYKTAYNNLTGYSLNIGGSETVFEPQDSDKGDIARAIFYMAARYNNYAGNDTIDGNNPNLVLLNNLSENSRTGTSSSNNPFGMGLLSDLLAWNKLDPVDEYEIHRNNLLYKNYTNNRNPFIDFPSWADDIWGTADLDGKNYNSSPVSYAKPASDPINTSGTANDFSISTNSLSMKVNDTMEICGRNANSAISWTVSDNTVVSLNKNSTSNNEKVIVAALKSGSTTITATCGGDSVTCSVTVSNVNYGTIENPLTVDEALAVIDINGTNATDQQLYVRGIASSNSDYNTQYNNYDYVWLQSDDGTVPNALQLFRIKADYTIKNAYGTEGSMVGKTVTAQGYGMIYGAKYEIYKSNNIQPYIKSVEEPAGSRVDDYLGNTSPYLDLLAVEGTETTDEVVDFPMEDANIANEGYAVDVAIGDVTLNGAKGSHATLAPRYYTNSKDLRVYVGNTFTFTCATNITSIAFTFLQNNQSALTPSVGSFNNNVWEGSSTEVTFTNSSNAQVRFTKVVVTYDIETFAVSNVALRFGAIFSKADWNTIHDEWSISDYGVMIVKKTTLNDTYDVDTVAEAHTNGENLLDLHKKGYADPSSFDEDNYLFTVKLNMTLQSNYNVTYCAAPYIVANGTYYFLDQIETSVNDLADELLSSGNSSLSDEALTLLSTLH